LHSCCSRGVTAGNAAIDHIETTLPLVQLQLEVGSAGPWVVLSAPLDVENAIGSSAANGGENPKPSVQRIKIVPVREDGVVVRSPRQAQVGKASIRGRELSSAVR
jgi:hypothetical protein